MGVRGLTIGTFLGIADAREFGAFGNKKQQFNTPYLVPVTSVIQLNHLNMEFLLEKS
jgi:hypothetical protein